jgi:hypothetical protein
MGKVIFDISMSLDGFITGANARPEAGWGGLGDGGERLHDWGFNNSADPRNLEIMEGYTSAERKLTAGRRGRSLSPAAFEWIIIVLGIFSSPWLLCKSGRAAKLC